MGEMTAIETLVDTLVALNLDDLDEFNTACATRVLISTALTAYTDGDIGSVSEVNCETDIKSGIDCIQKLIAKEIADDLKRHNK